MCFRTDVLAIVFLCLAGLFYWALVISLIIKDYSQLTMSFFNWLAVFVLGVWHRFICPYLPFDKCEKYDFKVRRIQGC